MGTIVAAAIVAHHPGLFRPEADRLALGNGKDSDLVEGFERVRARLDAAQPDTLLIIDTHWFTTQRHICAGADHYEGLYTSAELPWILHGLRYDYDGAPQIGREIQRVGDERKVPVFNAVDPAIQPEYPTINMVNTIRRDERILRVGICQNARMNHFLQMGEVIGEAIAAADGQVALIACGALSHRMIDMDFVPRNPCNWHPDNISDPAHVVLDHEIMDLWAKGDHARVIERYPELRAAAYEGFGGHYLQMVGALGGRDCTARGEVLTEYENAMGTGNVHIWFHLH
ncbi:MAG: extradiol ring-cleavage dioxygenase [Burkholderiaceae bacterium]